MDSEIVPASARHEVFLEVSRFGLYTVSVTSEQGVGVQLVDRVAGPGEIAGEVGVEDGRLDVFLDVGEYKIVSFGADNGRGEAKLMVRASEERAAGLAPQLIENRSFSAGLEDGQQQSFWLNVEHRRWIQLEAAGRALGDLRLWRDGSWLVDAEPVKEITDPRVGKPLLACRLEVELEPGLYLVSAYGLKPLPWAEDDGDHPFHIRFGLEQLATEGRARFTMSPFGSDRYLVPARADYYRLELEEQSEAQITVGRFASGATFAGRGEVEVISKESREPVAEVRLSSSSNGFDLVTVEGQAGQPYLLQHFLSRNEASINGSGEHWVSTVHSGHAEDSVDATGILVDWGGPGVRKRPLREQTVFVDGETGWSTRCNLLSPLTVFLDVAETGAYVIESRGVEARFLIEPFLLYRPNNYEAPLPQPAGATWDLDAGYYVLTVEPVEKGILEIAFWQARKPGIFDALVDYLVGSGEDDLGETRPVMGAVRFSSVPLSHKHSYTLYVNRQPGVETGIVVRKLPLNLENALPLSLRPQEEIEIPFVVAEPSRLSAVAEDGTSLELVIGEDVTREAIDVDRSGVVIVRNPGSANLTASLLTRPLRLLSTAPLPPLPEASLAALPDFPVVSEGRARVFDLHHGGSTTFRVVADRDALYRLETTGLLDTDGKLRSRIVPDLDRQTGGSSGRNFFINQYLHQGEYQVTVAVRGQSAGHLGLELTVSEPHDGGILEPGRPARLGLAAGTAVVYRFEIFEPGTYRLQSFALGRAVRCRLEDEDGWPIEPPNIVADVRRHFEPGSYRLFVLPEPVPGRRVTKLERIEEALVREGHGPHQLELGNAVAHRWQEPLSGEERQPDAWVFDLPAQSGVTVSLDAEMHGRLYRLRDHSTAEVAYIPPRRGWQGELSEGAYRLEVECVRVNNNLDYHLRLEPEHLLAGMSRSISAPVRLPVAIGSAQLVEIASSGPSDVRARLVDADGATVLVSDDREGDWNFLIAARLDSGAYTLEVDPVGATAAVSTVSVSSWSEVLHPPVALPIELEVATGNEVHVWPIETRGSELMVFGVRASNRVGLAVEARSENAWYTVVSRSGSAIGAELVADPELDYRLRMWSVDRRGGVARLQGLLATPGLVSEQELADRLRLKPLPGFEPPLAVAAVRATKPGLFQIRGDTADIRWSASGDALKPVTRGLLPVEAGTAWLAVAAGGGAAVLSAERVVLGEGVSLVVSVGPQQPLTVDLNAQTGAAVVALASALGRQPGVAVVEQTTVAAGFADPLRTVVAPGYATSVLLEARQPAAQVWSAETNGAAADVRLQSFTFDPVAAKAVEFGVQSGVLGVGEASRFALPRGEKHLRLTLTRGVVAAVAEGSEIGAVVSGFGDNVTESLVTETSSLWIFNPGAEEARFSVAIRPSDRPVPGGPVIFEGYLGEAGVLRLSVGPADRGQRIFVSGASGPSTLMMADGTAQRGEILTPGPTGGWLRVPHDPALVVVWIAPEGDPGAGLWFAEHEKTPVGVTPPARIRLEGRHGRWRIVSSEHALLKVMVDEPVVASLSADDMETSWIHRQPGARHLPLPAGGGELLLRGIGGAQLSGVLELELTPVQEIGEGLGPEVLLAPGGAVAFRFAVGEVGPVGIGARADSDLVECELLNAEGTVLGEGLVQLHDLGAGIYTLLVTAPVDRAATRVRPAVVGVERPPTGPPEEIIRGYLERERTGR